jgi:hypothetical protein
MTIAERTHRRCRLVRPVNPLDPYGASAALWIQRLRGTEVWAGALGLYEWCLTVIPDDESGEAHSGR